jgi:hypothetical protein
MIEGCIIVVGLSVFIASCIAAGVELARYWRRRR